LDALIRYKDKRVGKRYCEDNGLKFIRVESYELHTRLYFQKDEISSWVNYETDENYKITWKREAPLEKHEALKLKKSEYPPIQTMLTSSRQFQLYDV
jgi:hypothetical protein